MIVKLLSRSPCTRWNEAASGSLPRRSDSFASRPDAGCDPLMRVASLPAESAIVFSIHSPNEPCSAVESVPSNASVKVHLVLPRSFNDAQQIADRFKEGMPVILNLQGSDQELAKRLIDFASGLTYALNGGMQRVADKVFLLTPRNVEVSAEQRAQLLERGGFFNQA